MNNLGSQLKRHIPVRYPKSWRRKKRKATGTIEAIAPNEANCHSPHLQQDNTSEAWQLQPSQPVAQGFVSRDVCESPISNFGTGEDNSDSSTDKDIHELYDLGDQDNDICHVFISDESEESGGQNSEGGHILPYRRVEHMMFRKHVLSALCLVIGSSRVTAKQYNLSRALTNHEGQYQKREGYPCYSTLSGNVLPVMRRCIYVPTVLQHMEINSKLAGAPQPIYSETGECIPVFKSFKVILPSSWARKDMNTLPYFSSDPCAVLYSYLQCPRASNFDIEETAIARLPSLCFRSNILQSVSRTGNVWISNSNVHDVTEIEVILHLPPQRIRPMFTSLGAVLQNEDGHQTLLLRAKVLLTSTTEQVAEDHLTPGDVVSILEVPDCPSDVTVLLVHRMKRQTRHPMQSVILRSVNDEQKNLTARCKRISAVTPSVSNPGQDIPLPRVHNYGRLADGRFYSVYRVILYSDDFEQFAQKKGSAGGCYMLPVGIPLQHRRGLGSVRVLSLTPPGISTNKAILSIIPDIVSATKHGFEGVDIFGTRRTVFIEVIAYIGDYQAVRHILDVTGPRGLAPCPLCTFPKGSLVGAKNSDYAYSVTSHSGHASFRRDKRRMLSLRRNRDKAPELQEVGLQDVSIQHVSNLPLHALSDALEKIRDEIPRTEHGKPVVSGVFDPYLSTLVAPDHLFFGLGEDVINANMRVLPKPRRIIAETLMKHALLSNGMATEPHLYNHQKLQLHSMSISTMFNLILVAPWSLYQCNAYNSEGKRVTLQSPLITGCLELMFRYQKLVSDTMFIPTCDVDGKDTVITYNNAEGNSRLSYLKKQCAEYIHAVDSISGENELAKRELDKPNIHRMLELFNHTIPLVGHVRHCQELLFEAAHQPLKRGLKKSNYRDPQLTAIDTILADDWKSRLGHTIQGFGCKQIAEWTTSECMQLNRVFCGQMDDEETIGREDEIAAHIKECFKQPVADHLLSITREHEGMRAKHWIPFGCEEKGPFNFAPSTDTTAALRYLQELNRCQVDNGGVIRRVIYAKSVQGQAASGSSFAVNGNALKNSVYLMRRSDVIQAAVQVSLDTFSPSSEPVKMLYIQEEHVECSSAASCNRMFWVVLDIITVSPPSGENEAKDSMFAVVWPVTINTTLNTPISKYYKVYSVLKRDTLFVLPLRRSVRKVMALHLCNWNKNESCSVIPHGQSCTHDGSVEGGHPFLLFGSIEGFPPRNG